MVYFFFFLAGPYSLRDLSSPTRIEPRPSAVKEGSLNLRATREFPRDGFHFTDKYIQ